MRRLKPLIKGLITGAVMVLFVLSLDFFKLSANNNLQYIIYVIYAAGILWTLIEYNIITGNTAKFGELFGQGFRFMVPTILVLVVYTIIYQRQHPEIAVQYSNYARETLVKEKSRTPEEIDKAVNDARKQFATRFVSATIFSNLISGAIFTAAGAGLILLRRNKPWT